MSSSDIQNRLVKYITNLDPDADLTQGPIYDLMLQPIPSEIDLAATNAAQLLSLYGRINDASQLTTAELEAVGLNLRVSRVAGSKATVDLKFVLSSTPTTTVTIPSGTAVATSDYKYVFVTNYGVTITPATAYAFYNSATGKYEAYVTATAQNIGSGYNLPLNKINTLISNLSAVQAVTNTVASSGGTDSSDNLAYYTRVQTALNGMDPSSLSSYFNAISRDTTYRDYTLFVSSADRTKFKRRVVGNAFDVYIGTPSYATYVDTFTYTSGTNVFPLGTSPVYAVQYITINNNVLDTTSWSLSLDTSSEYTKSTAGTNTVKITSALAYGDVVSIYYTVNKNCLDVQTALNRLNPQNVTFLVREMTRVPIKITLSVVATQVASTTIDSITTLVSSLCNDSQSDSISVYDIQNVITTSIPSIRMVNVTELHRVSNSNGDAIQNINLAFNEMLTLDVDNGDLVITAAS